MSSLFSKFSRLLPFLFTASIGGGAFFLQQGFRSNLSETTLRNGRIVLSSGAFVFHSSDPGRNGSELNLQDGKDHTAAIIAYPAQHPQGTWLLIDAALSHWPPAAGNPRPRPRRPRAVILHNGVCTGCSRNEFQAYGRIKRVRLEMLARRANNPDQEFKHAAWRVTYARTLLLPDRPGPFRIKLPMPAAAPSPGYPRGVEFLAAKLTILEIYPGVKYRDRVALAEFTYLDAADPALRNTNTDHIWK